MNRFCWVDLSAHDHQSAKSFYHQVFGWTTKDVPGAMGREYSQLLDNGKPVGGLFSMPPEMRRLQMTPHWTGYIHVDSVEETAHKAGNLGATVICVMEVGATGKMSIIKDPTGAAFSLWEGDEQRRTDVLNAELLCTDLKNAHEFYPHLFGWTPAEAGFTYENKPVAGLIPMPNMPGVRAQWNVYFPVDDCDATVDKAQKAGGKLVGGPFDLPSGRTAVLQDPEGATFCVVKRVP